MVAAQEQVALRARMRFTGRRELSLTFTGELDLATAHTVAPFTELLINLEVRDVTLDLSPLTFVDVEGWRALEALQADLRAASIHVIVDSVSPSLRRIQDLMAEISSTRHARRYEHPAQEGVTRVKPPTPFAEASPPEPARSLEPVS